MTKKINKSFKTRIQRFLLFRHWKRLYRLLLILLLLILLGTLAIWVFEPNTSLADAFWLTIVTLTTVGYGDITPTTLVGRIIGIFIMFFGIGILMMFTATIASIFVKKHLKAERGMGMYNFENHLILCEWNHRAREILQELRSDYRFETECIVLIAELDIKPLDDEHLFFVQGVVNEENLRRANLERALTVIILGDDRLDPSARDAKAVLSTLTVEYMNPKAYTIVELVDISNVQHCKHANANEIIVSSEFGSKLISRAALDHGISEVLSDLLSSRLGKNDLFKIPVPEHLATQSFIEIFSEMKLSKNSIVLALQTGKTGAIISNPPPDYIVERDDHLIVIAEGRPGSLS